MRERAQEMEKFLRALPAGDLDLTPTTDTEWLTTAWQLFSGVHEYFHAHTLWPYTHSGKYS